MTILHNDLTMQIHKGICKTLEAFRCIRPFEIPGRTIGIHEGGVFTVISIL